MDIVALILISLVIIYLVIDKLKKKQEEKTYIQVVDNFIVYNKNGVIKGKVSKGDTILGKYLENNSFIIADVEDLPFLNNLGTYLSNGKTKNKR